MASLKFPSLMSLWGVLTCHQGGKVIFTSPKIISFDNYKLSIILPSIKESLEHLLLFISLGQNIRDCLRHLPEGVVVMVSVSVRILDIAFLSFCSQKSRQA